MAAKPGSKAPTPAAPVATSSKTLELRVPKKEDRKIFVGKFSNAMGVDFAKWKQKAPEMGREISVPEEAARSGPNAEEAPKGAAGSEMGKERRDAARQRRYVRHKKPEDAPWILQDNSKESQGPNAKDTQPKRYRGIKEGGVQDNSAYYVFTTVGGRIEAYPVSDWYTFAPVQRYKTLTSEEAEEAFEKRDKVLNHFNIMTKNRLKADKDDDMADDEGGGGKGSSKPKSRLKIREDDDDMPQEMSDSDEEGTAAETGAADGVEAKGGKGKKKTKKPVKPKKVKQTAVREDGEPGEESDDGDFETREMDYEEASSSSSEEDEKAAEEPMIKGIDEEIEEMLDDDDEADEKDAADEEADNNADDAESESDNEEEDIDAIADSAIPQAKRVDVSSPSTSAGSSVAKDASKGSVPKNGKRKQQDAEPPNVESSSPATKRAKPSTSAAAPSTNVVDGKLEEEVRMYLSRKPMTSLELLRKLTKKGGPERTAEIKARLGDIIKRLNPEKNTNGSKLYMHLKK